MMTVQDMMYTDSAVSLVTVLGALGAGAAGAAESSHDGSTLCRQTEVQAGGICGEYSVYMKVSLVIGTITYWMEMSKKN